MSVASILFILRFVTYANNNLLVFANCTCETYPVTLYSVSETLFGRSTNRVQCVRLTINVHVEFVIVGLHGAVVAAASWLYYTCQYPRCFAAPASIIVNRVNSCNSISRHDSTINHCCYVFLPEVLPIHRACLPAASAEIGASRRFRHAVCTLRLYWHLIFYN